MATDTFVNILDIQPITEVVNGDYLIVETPAGTRIINFKNFILPNSNILISQTVADNTTAILSNFSVLNDYITTLSASIDKNITGYSTSLDSISTILQDQITTANSTIGTRITETNTNLQSQMSNLSSKLYVGTASITINTGASNGVGTLSPVTTNTLSIQNISITPANAYATKNPAYVANFLSNNIITLSSPFSGVTATSDAVYNILVVSNS